MTDHSDGNRDFPSAPRMTRRAALAQSAAGATALACGLAGCATKVTGMASKMEAQYQDRPNGLLRCGICAHFISPSACEVVAGPVQANGFCRYYDLFIFHLT